MMGGPLNFWHSGTPALLTQVRWRRNVAPISNPTHQGRHDMTSTDRTEDIDRAMADMAAEHTSHR